MDYIKERNPPQIDDYISQLPHWVYGEYALLSAILTQAMSDLYNLEFRDGAIDWLMDDTKTSKDPGSFKWCVNHLDLDLVAVRDRVRYLIKYTSTLPLKRDPNY
jgi:hypothetical protein